MHITQIKDFFKQTNIRKNYKRQIIDHNVEKFSLMIKHNIDIFPFIKILINVNHNNILQINSMSSANKIGEEIKQHIKKNK